MTTASVIIKRFGQVRIHARDERGLQDEVEGLLRTLPFDFRREVSCAAGDLDWQLRQATGIAKAPYVAEAEVSS